MLFIPIHDFGMFFHLFRSLISLTMFCIFQGINFHLLMLSLSLSILFDAVVSGIVFLISFLDCLLQVFGGLLILTFLILKL